MTTRTLRTLLTVPALATALVALPARADRDDWRHRDEHGPGFSASISVQAVPVAPPYAWPAPAPLYAPPPPVPAPPAVAVGAPFRPAHWGGGWRMRALRHEYRELDEARDRFYATWDGRPWTRARFEAWYASRRAALDARWAELGRWR